MLFGGQHPSSLKCLCMFVNECVVYATCIPVFLTHGPQRPDGLRWEELQEEKREGKKQNIHIILVYL